MLDVQNWQDAGIRTCDAAQKSLNKIYWPPCLAASGSSALECVGGAGGHLLGRQVGQLTRVDHRVGLHLYMSYIGEEETDKREGKGRRCCLGDGIHRLATRTILRKGLIEERTLGRIDASEK